MPHTSNSSPDTGIKIQVRNIGNGTKQAKWQGYTAFHASAFSYR